MKPKITIADIEKAVDLLKPTHEQGYVFIILASLNGLSLNERSVIILCGNKVYYPEAYNEKEAVVLELPEYKSNEPGTFTDSYVKDEYNPLKKFHVEQNLEVIANENVFNTEKYFGLI